MAIRLHLPVRLDQNLPLPVNFSAANPSFRAGSEFREFRIQTIRDSLEDDECVVFTDADDPFDPEFSAPYFGLYGVKADGLLEHIADRRTFAEAVRLAENLWPGVEFKNIEGGGDG